MIKYSQACWTIYYRRAVEKFLLFDVSLLEDQIASCVGLYMRDWLFIGYYLLIDIWNTLIYHDLVVLDFIQFKRRSLKKELTSRCNGHTWGILIVRLLVISVGVLIGSTLLPFDCRLASVAGAVIQAIGRPDFEDGSRTGSSVEVKCEYHSVRTKPEVNMARHLMQAVTLGAVYPLRGYCSVKQ